MILPCNRRAETFQYRCRACTLLICWVLRSDRTRCRAGQIFATNGRYQINFLRAFLRHANDHFFRFRFYSVGQVYALSWKFSLQFNLGLQRAWQNWFTITSDQIVHNNSPSFWTRRCITRQKLLRCNKFIICFAWVIFQYT